MKFDILKLFTRDEPIAGVEINDDFIRLALLDIKSNESDKKLGKKLEKPEKNIQVIEIKALGEKSLKEGVIINGELKDKASFVGALNNLLGEIKPRIRYAIISLPSNNVYSRIYSFPKTVSSEKIEDAMKLSIGFQLPNKTEDIYLDWEKGESQKNIFNGEKIADQIDNNISEKKEIFLAKTFSFLSL